MAMAHSIPQEYRLPFMGELDERFRRFLAGSGVFGLLVLLAILITPRREVAITEVTQVPERFAKLIVEEPKPVAAPTPTPAAGTTPKAKEAEPAPPPPQQVRRRDTPPPVAPDAGQVGRAKAQKEVTQTLQGATTAAKSAIQDLSASLGKTTTPTVVPPTGGRRRSVAGGRSASQVGRVSGTASAGGGATVAGSAVTGSLISVEAVSDVAAAGDGSEGGSAAGGSGGGAAVGTSSRSNASLLAVVRRYAPGIQFCYDNELKRAPGLRGKIVAALTVAASGRVTDVRIVSDSVGSQRLASCVLAQIREWQFPAVASGTTVFKTPFVFTPPKE
jgi:protein TonB